MSILRSFIIGKSGKRIVGITERPDSPGKYPVILMLHGFSGDHIVSGFKFPRVSRLLVERGFATVRFDFRGSGDSEGSFEDMSILTELSDAMEVFGYVKKKEFYNHKLGIIGYSMGGAVASLLAPKVKDTSAVCLWSPAIFNKEVFQSGPMIKKLSEQPFIDVGGLKISTVFAQDCEKVNAYEELLNYKKNLRIIHGSKDESVDFIKVKSFCIQNSISFHPIENADHKYLTVGYMNELFNQTVDFFCASMK
ncbi:MAG TPA: alpha/beta fold hydrolase [Petrotogaceae bacterium]|nr:alpha/beta fold hydrolase [Petrotogaceae bacterium]HQH31927.1 alpha/beta fold hydrolase [Petrotogaceae bacterium]